MDEKIKNYLTDAYNGYSKSLAQVDEFLAQQEQQLEEAILATRFNQGICPIFQNTTALPTKNINEIKVNLIHQLTASVKWTQTMQNMIKKNIDSVTEVGPGKVLQGLFKKVDRQINTYSALL